MNTKQIFYVRAMLEFTSYTTTSFWVGLQEGCVTTLGILRVVSNVLNNYKVGHRNLIIRDCRLMNLHTNE